MTSDGRAFVYGKSDREGLFLRSLEGDPATNKEEELAADYKAPGADLTAFPDGIYYASWNGEGKPRTARFYSYAQKKSIDVFPLPGPYRTPMSLTVSPDRRSMIFGKLSGLGTDLILLELQ